MISQADLSMASPNTDMELEQSTAEAAEPPKDIDESLQQYMQNSEEPQSQEESPLNTAFIAEDSKLIISDHQSILSEVQSLSSISRIYQSQTSWVSQQSYDFQQASVEEDSDEPMPRGKRPREQTDVEQKEIQRLDKLTKCFKKKSGLVRDVDKMSLQPAPKLSQTEVFIETLESIDRRYDKEFGDM